MSLEQTFLQFLRDWLAWAEAGGPEHSVFDEEQGLCPNWRRYMRGRRLDDYLCGLEVSEAQKWYMKLSHTLLNDLGESTDPFGWYGAETEAPSHRWEPRLTWVRNKIKELEQCA